MRLAKTNFLILILAVLLLTGCGSGDSAEDAALVQAVTENPEYAPVPVSDIKCGFIFSGAADTEGIDMLVRQGLKSEQIMLAENVDIQSEESFREAFETEMGEGCFLIFAVDSAFAPYCDILAQENPDVLICCKGAVSTGFNNYIGYLVQDEGDFYCRAVQTVVSGKWNGEDYYDE